MAVTVYESVGTTKPRIITIVVTGVEAYAWTHQNRAVRLRQVRVDVEIHTPIESALVDVGFPIGAIYHNLCRVKRKIPQEFMHTLVSDEVTPIIYNGGFSRVPDSLAEHLELITDVWRGCLEVNSSQPLYINQSVARSTVVTVIYDET
ncbi:MAG: hypothetical protein M0Q12_09095 [Synergistaceae bacterium]|nr:hypothetical protein [Synergistaceae bacterium]